MQFRDFVLFSTLVLSAQATSVRAEEPSDEIPPLGPPQMQLLRDFDPDEFPPPPPPPPALSDEERRERKSTAMKALEAFQRTALGKALHRELIRREEVCGSRYTWEQDSVNDFATAPTDWMPARVKVLSDPQKAFLAKKLAIEQASCEIWVNTYIFNDAPTTRALLTDLASAIERGVSVRFVIDSTGSASGAFGAHADLKSLNFVKPGKNASPLCEGQMGSVDTVTFNPFFRVKNFISSTVAKILNKADFTSVDINRRSHDKILLADAHYPQVSLAIVGGRNWTDSYYGIPEPDSHTYEDMEVLVRDDVSKESRVRLIDTVGAHAQRLLCHKGNRWIRPGWFTPNKLREYRRDHAKLISSPTVQKLLPEMKTEQDPFAYINEGLHPAQVRWGDEIENIRRPADEAFQDPNRLSTRTNNPNSIVDLSRDLISRARRSIRVVSPYLYLSKAERDSLKKWAVSEPGRKLMIISNSMMTSDNVPAQTLVDRVVAPDFVTESTLPDGAVYRPNPENIAFYELGRLDSDRLEMNANNPDKKPYGKLHAKYWTIDGEVSFIGSHNFDPRSRYYNSEVGFFIRSRKVAAELEGYFKETQDRSYLFQSDEWKQLISLPAFKRINRMQNFLETVFEEFPGLASLI